MSKRKFMLLTGSVLLFIVLVALAIYFESTQFLYVASALPILIVLLIPDIRQNQFIDVKKNSGIRLVKHTEGQVPLLMIDFAPGSIEWHKSKLFFNLNQLTEADGKAKAPLMSASLSVLSFDLSFNKRKPGLVGISLKQLAERTRSLSYTTDEVTRFVIRMSDLEEAAVQMISAGGSASLSGKSKSLQA